MMKRALRLLPRPILCEVSLPASPPPPLILRSAILQLAVGSRITSLHPYPTQALLKFYRQTGGEDAWALDVSRGGWQQNANANTGAGVGMGGSGGACVDGSWPWRGLEVDAEVPDEVVKLRLPRAKASSSGVMP